MNIRRSLLVCYVMCAAAPAAFLEPGLPAWDEGQRDGLEKGGWVAGGLLLSEEPVPEGIPKGEGEPLTLSQPTVEEIAGSEAPANEIPEVFWPAYFGSRPETFLVDPQRLLSRVDYRDRLGFLNYHSGDSSIDLFVYLFKGDQEIPGEVREEELIERFFSEGRPAAVVYYHMGAPERSVLYLSPSLTDTVSVAEQRRAMESSVMQAFKYVDPSKQIDAFLVQMSIRIYWMERMLSGAAESTEALPVRPRVEKTSGHHPSMMEKLQPHINWLRNFEVPAAAIAGGLLVALLVRCLIKRRTHYRFPELDVEPRLGGSHAAGVGAVISFASAAVPPASQRDQVPDYLRRA